MIRLRTYDSLKLLFLCLIWLMMLIFSPHTATGADHTSYIPDGTLRRIYAPILMYHYVGPLPANADDLRTDLTVSPAMFRAHIQYLHDAGYETISLYDLHNALFAGAPLPPKPVILTFDDGYVDHYTYVLPVLREFGFTGTFFIITDNADSNTPGYLNWTQITEMAAAGMSMESHAKNHVDLRNRDRDFLIYQILGSLESLTAHTGQTASMFCYPSGRYDDVTLKILDELPVLLAVTTQNGDYHTTSAPLELSRLRVGGEMWVAALAGLLRKSR